jgi:hypothetical protein
VQSRRHELSNSPDPTGRGTIGAARGAGRAAIRGASTERGPNGAKGQRMTMESYAGTVNAPDFPPEMEWLNTDRPVTLRELRGKLVLLEFWTFC